MAKYAFRIYKPEFSYANYDDNIYREKETAVNKDDLSVDIECDSLNDIKKAFFENIDTFEGATYCVKNLKYDTIIVGGAFDPYDIDIICEYFEN